MKANIFDFPERHSYLAGKQEQKAFDDRVIQLQTEQLKKMDNQIKQDAEQLKQKDNQLKQKDNKIMALQLYYAKKKSIEDIAKSLKVPKETVEAWLAPDDDAPQVLAQ